MLQEGNTAWLGIHDYFEEGDWVTVKDETLENTGYTRWTIKWPDELDNLFDSNKNFAALISEGEMDDLRCDTSLPFFCEIPL